MNFFESLSMTDIQAEPPLLKAILQGDIQQVMAIAANHPDEKNAIKIHSPALGNHKNIPLLLAVLSGNIEMPQLVLNLYSERERRTQLYKFYYEGYKLLAIAGFSNHDLMPAAVLALYPLEQQLIELNYIDSFGENLLMRIIRFHNPQGLQALFKLYPLEQRSAVLAHFTRTEHGEYACFEHLLIHVVRSGDILMLESVVSLYEDTQQLQKHVDTYTKELLAAAVISGKVAMLNEVIKRWPQLQAHRYQRVADGANILMLAVNIDMFEAVLKLYSVENQTRELNHTTLYGENILHYAMKYHNDNAAPIVRYYSVPTHHATRKQLDQDGFNLPWLAVRNLREDDPALLQITLALYPENERTEALQHCPPNAPQDKILSFVARKQYSRITDFLLKNYDLGNEQLRQAYEVSLSYGRTNIRYLLAQALLLQAYATGNFDTAIDLELALSQPDLRSFLVNLSDETKQKVLQWRLFVGKTALENAIATGKVDIITLFLEHSAIRKGLTEYAQKNGQIHHFYHALERVAAPSNRQSARAPFEQILSLSQRPGLYQEKDKEIILTHLMNGKYRAFIEGEAAQVEKLNPAPIADFIADIITVIRRVLQMQRVKPEIKMGNVKLADLVLTGDTKYRTAALIVLYALDLNQKKVFNQYTAELCGLDLSTTEGFTATSRESLVVQLKAKLKQLRKSNNQIYQRLAAHRRFKNIFYLKRRILFTKDEKDKQLFKLCENIRILQEQNATLLSLLPVGNANYYQDANAPIKILNGLLSHLYPIEAPRDETKLMIDHYQQKAQQTTQILTPDLIAPPVEEAQKAEKHKTVRLH